MARAVSALQALRGAQARAAGPDAHVWLSASAGTGKTHVLTARVYRLLLGGVSPENILCLTFTKAGASEMAERIHSRLAAWVQMDGPELASDLMALGEDHGPDAQAQARLLFARVLEATGGGLRIQTIHGFCQQLLASFPMEAGLIPGFRALEEREQRDLARRTLTNVVLQAESAKDEVLITALQAMALRMGEEKAERYLLRCGAAHDALQALDPDIRHALFAAFELPEGDVNDVIALACSDDLFDMAAISRLVAANEAWGTKTGLETAAKLRAWRGFPEEQRAEGLAVLKSCVFTTKDEPKAVQKKLVEAEPDYEALALRVGERCKQLVELRDWVAYADLLAQALHAGRAFARAYEAAKRSAAAVDYDDLIARAATLLHQPGISEWIRFKLDQRTDHILVDEAQDTNDRQWRIIGALADEFFAGLGAQGERMRTLFTVGDFKQAIFGFQGTSPRAFSDARDRFRSLALAADHDFHDLSLDESFRSVPAVLEIVDATVAEVGPENLGLASDAVRHSSARPFPGEVTLWRPIAAGMAEDAGADDTPEGEEDWLADHQRLLAQKIAEQIREWLSDGLMLQSRGRPLRPGDVMILLRKRGDLARLIVARLYEAGVPVAGIDRLRLQAPLAVRDLMAALRFAAQPEDDLNLANLLVSPLIGWSQEDLLSAAIPRRDGLWRHLRAQAAAGGPDIAALSDILAQADFVTPYRLLERILSGPMLGRRRLVERLGEEARDAIDELLQAALDFEQDDTPGLQPFIDWFDRAEGDIKREDDGQSDAVRLLTVHGAKGLQAPVVILADAAADPERVGGRDGLDWTAGEGIVLPLIPPRKGEQIPMIATARQAAEQAEREEHWRLMYVAMTRAEERLVLTGTLGKRAKGEIPAQSWFGAASRALAALGGVWKEDPRWGAAGRWTGLERLKPARAEPAAARDAGSAHTVPDWLTRNAPDEARPPRPLAPTGAIEDDTPDPPPGPALRAAAERGKLLHALFERLPDVEPSERRDCADRWLERSAGIADAGARQVLIDHALAIIDQPRFAEIFGPDALAEAPIAAIVGEAVVAGTVDRLLVTDERVHIVDFKTGRFIPNSIADIPAAHVRQMAAYVAALEVVFPTRSVEASLLYTSGPTMIGLPSVLLDPHKPGFEL
ncbi:double-strand break repair helicase AddA [Sphingobium subterraneum]|uniref:DNA 3'-5' helicase n=1 Tax=Sphingobium subterraneum TaxID=627688 RepID=A0A841J4J8_9SPHN|nr:double-strand break repair helicase AddA [Sphingobium subterraneum]MBB6123171.1 ATP-dependent helicase/nuclease subunit A [Sphingobium subterraneum]